jgi:hypothetical protein
MANEQNLKPFNKGYDVRRVGNGRPKKYITQLKAIGYTNSEIVETLMVLLSLNIYELNEVFKNPEATILELSVAKALVKGIERGNIYTLNELLNRIMGKPRESATITNDEKIEVVFIEGKTIL